MVRPTILLTVVLLMISRSALAAEVEPVGKTPEIALSQLKRSAQYKAGKNLFVAKTWSHGAAPRPVKQSVTVERPVEAPVAPIAPPLPFTYIGKMLDEESGRLVLYLSKGDIPYSVSVGDVIDEIYKVETISEKELTLIYLPMNTKQILFLGGNDS